MYRRVVYLTPGVEISERMSGPAYATVCGKTNKLLLCLVRRKERTAVPGNSHTRGINPLFKTKCFFHNLLVHHGSDGSNNECTRKPFCTVAMND